MICHSPYPWPKSTQEAITLQQAWRGLVASQANGLSREKITYMAGIDIGFIAQGTIARAAVVLLEATTLTLQESTVAYRPVTFPYVPGLLSFREIPVILQAIAQLKQLPDLIHCDGQGIAHPRRFGLASHLGVITGIATVGVAKSRLIGQHDEPGEQKGSYTPLWDHGEQIGVVLRTRSRIRPLYISVGHKTNLEMAVDSVLTCTTCYRLPETTRLAHKIASEKTLE